MLLVSVFLFRRIVACEPGRALDAKTLDDAMHEMDTVSRVSHGTTLLYYTVDSPLVTQQVRLCQLCSFAGLIANGQDRDGVVDWLEFQQWWVSNGGSTDTGSGGSSGRRRLYKRREFLGSCCARPLPDTSLQG